MGKVITRRAAKIQSFSLRKISVALPILLFLVCSSLVVLAADPGHVASSISSGTFESGNYTFPDTLEILRGLNVTNGLLYVDPTTNNVGIGTTSPQSTMHIEKSVSTGSRESLRFSNPASSSNTYGSLGVGTNGWYDDWVTFQRNGMLLLGLGSDDYIKMYAHTSILDDKVLQATGDGNNQIELRDTALGNALRFNSGADIIFQGSGITSITFKNGGNVGIGTTTPNAKLQVVGDLNVSQGANFATSSGKVGIGTTSPGAELEVVGDVYIGNSADTSDRQLVIYGSGNSGASTQWIKTVGNDGVWHSGYGKFTVEPAGDFIFKPWNSGDENYTERMRLVTNTGALVIGRNYQSATGPTSGLLVEGNVGIGTVSPSAKLHVESGDVQFNGTGDATGFYYNQTSGNVGIGTTSPVTKLHVAGMIRVDNSIQTYGNLLGGGGYGIDIVPNGGSSWSGTYASRITGINTATSGTIGHFQILPTYNQVSATTANTDLLINRTETSIGSGAQYLIDAQVDGVSKFVITNTGNVGIGTDSPIYKLDVSGDAGFNEYLYHNDDADTYIRFLDNRIMINEGGENFIDILSGRIVLNQNNNDHDFRVAGQTDSDLLMVDGGFNAIGISYSSIDLTGTTGKLLINGSVGIGTTEPGTAKLNVTGVIDASQVLINGTAVSTGAGGGSMDYTNVAMTNQTNTFIAGQIIDNSSEVTTAYLNISDGRTTKFIVDPAGNVGIGTTNPGTNLEVGSITDNDSKGIKIIGGSSGGKLATLSLFTGATYGAKVEYDASTVSLSLINNYNGGASGAGNIIFGTNNVEKVRIDNQGNVGIGTTEPGTAKLNVTGVIDASQVLINGTAVSTGAGGGGMDYTNLAMTNQTNTFIAGQIIDNTTAVDAYLNISDGRSPKFIVDSAGNAGIGDASPTSRLSVSGDVNATGSVSAPLICIGFDCRDTWPTTGSAGGWTDDGTVVRLTSSDDIVGIGTNNPTGDKLYVVGNGTYTGDLVLGGDLVGTEGSGASGAGLLGWVDDGSVVRLATLDDNVGIGTTEPGTAKLNVTGVIDASQVLINGTEVSTGAGGGSMDYTNIAMTNQSNTFTTGQTIDNTSAVTDAYLNISDGTSPKFIVDSAGNVGIGMTAPIYALDINNDILANNYLRLKSSNSTARSAFTLLNDMGYDITLNGWGSTATGTLFGLNRSNLAALATNNFAALVVGTYSAHPLILATSNTERVRITDDGNVGIGTTGPDSLAKVHIVASTNQAGIYNERYDEVPLISFRRARGSLGSPTQVLSGDRLLLIASEGYYTGGSSGWGGVSRIEVYSEEDFTDTARGSNIVFKAVAPGTTSREERMRITGTGNVGIGTTNPESYRLYVSGATAYCDQANCWNSASTRELKENITLVTNAGLAEILEKIKTTPIYTFNMKNSSDTRTFTGVISEEAPREIVTLDGKGVSDGAFTNFLMAGMKAQQLQIEELKAQNEMLEQELCQRDSTYSWCAKKEGL